MKREILCLSCDNRMQEIEREIAKEEDFTTPPEKSISVYGRARRDFICDLCGKPIRKGERCAARTTFIIHPISGYPMEQKKNFSWHVSYIDPDLRLYNGPNNA